MSFFGFSHSFSLVATNQSMAQEIEYGDKECEPNNETSLMEHLEQKGLNISTDEYCKQNVPE
jgi:hypothetical protein